MSRKNALLLALGLIYSAAIAVCSFIFLQLEHELIHLVWYQLIPWAQGISAVFGAAMCAGMLALITLCLYQLRMHYPTAPEFIPQVKARLSCSDSSEQKTTSHLLSNTIATLLILAAGAGVGPEAPLLAMIYSSSIFMADKLRYLDKNFCHFEQAGIRTKLAMAVSYSGRVKRATQSADASADPHKDVVDNQDEKTQAPRSLLLHNTTGQLKAFIRASFIANGILCFFFLKQQTHTPSIIFRIPVHPFDGTAIAFTIPLICIAAVIGFLYTKLNQTQLASLHKTHPLIVLGLGALAIFVTHFIGVDYLFSGQFSLEQLVTEGLNKAPLVLLAIALLKLALLYLCNHTGWRGGDIFPLIYVAFALSLAASKLIAANPIVVMALMTPALLMQATHMGLVACIFVALFFPLAYLPILALSTALSWGLSKGYSVIAQRHYSA